MTQKETEYTPLQRYYFRFYVEAVEQVDLLSIRDTRYSLIMQKSG